MAGITTKIYAAATIGMVVAALGTAATASAAAGPAGLLRPLTSVTSGGFRLYSESMSAPVGSVTGTGTGTRQSDFDGDHIDDVVTSAGAQKAAKPNNAFLGGGGVVVQYSHAGRVDYFFNANLNDGGTFGWTYSGDFNGDGYDDLIIDNPQEIVGSLDAAGGFWVIYGSASGLQLATATHFNEDTSGVPGVAESNDQWGAAMATGDINGDGYADLAVGAPGESVGSVVGAGAVTVLYGSRTGLTSTGSMAFSEHAAGVPGTAEVADGFGSGVAIGDINADGYADLAVGASGEHTSTTDDVPGMVFVLRGSRTGLSFSGVQDVTAVSAETTQPDGALVKPVELGNELSIGDVNGDGYADLVAAVPQSTVGSEGRGAVFTFPGSASGISAATRKVISAESPGVTGTTPSIGDQFGLSMAIGDITGDGRADVVVGDSEYSVGGIPGGAFWLIPGSSSGLTGTGSHLYSQATAGVPGTPAGASGFSTSLTVLNLNGTGGLDVVVGAPGEINAGDKGGLASGTLTTFDASGGTLTPQGAQTGLSLSTPDTYLIDLGGLLIDGQRDSD